MMSNDSLIIENMDVSHSFKIIISQTFIRNLIRVDTAVATVSPNNQLLRQKQNLQRSQKQQLLRQQRLRTHCR